MKIKTPSLYGGISRQPAHLRYPNQVADATNAVFDVADGASKRPGSHLLLDLASLDSDGNYQLHTLVHGSDTLLVVIGPDSGGSVVLRAFHPDGREASVTVSVSAQAYLDTNADLGSDYRFASTAEYTLICNRKAPSGMVGAGDQPDQTKMPVKLTVTTPSTNTAAAVIDVDLATWTQRSLGDNSSNPGATLLVQTKAITDITFYRGRLVLAGHTFVAMSKTSDYFNFFLDDPANLVDSDAIDTPLGGGSLSEIQSVAAFKKSLVVFTVGGQQFETNPESVTPANLVFDASTRYETLDIPPVVVGSVMYFLSTNPSGGVLHEYLYNESQVSNVAAETTRHTNGYLPFEMRSLVGSVNSTTVMALPNNQQSDAMLLTEGGLELQTENNETLLIPSKPVGTNELFVYRYYWTGGEDDGKAQSAWGLYRFGDDDQIADLTIDGNRCYLLTNVAAQGYILEHFDLGKGSDIAGDLPFVVRLDRQHVLSGSFDGSDTTWTLPSAALQANTVVLGASFGASAGQAVSVSQNGTTLTASGNYAQGSVIAGQSYTFALELSQAYRRDRNGIADINGQLAIQRLTALHHQSGSYQIKAAMPYRDDRVHTFTARALESGQSEAWLNGLSDEITYTIESTSVMPVTISAVELEATYYPRG